MRAYSAFTAVVLLGLPSANAAPTMHGLLGEIAIGTLAQPVASWRYHRECVWNGSGWSIDLGDGRVVLCRPYRPNREWYWHTEGPRHGWYHRKRNVWHYNKW